MTSNTCSEDMIIYIVSSDIQDTSGMHREYVGYGIPLYNPCTAYTTSTMYTMDTMCVLLRVGTHEQYHVMKHMFRDMMYSLCTHCGYPLTLVLHHIHH